MADKPKEEAAKPAKGSKKKLLIIIIAAVVVLVGGAGAFFALSGSSKSTAKPEPTPSAVVPLDAITLNLAGGHYLKISIALQTTTNAPEGVDGSKALDLMISEFSNKSVASLSTNASRDAAKEQLTKQVVDAYSKKGVVSVMAVYFTEFVIQ